MYERAGLQAFPTMAVVLGWPGRMTDPAFGVDDRLVVAGDIKVVLHRPLAVEGKLLSRPRIKEVIDKGPGNAAIIQNTRDLIAEDGTLVATVDSSTFARKHGGFGGKVTDTPVPPQCRRPRPEQSAICRRRPNLALLYRLNGDENPLHARSRARQGRRLRSADSARRGRVSASRRTPSCGPSRTIGRTAEQHRGAVLASPVFPARRSAPKSGPRTSTIVVPMPHGRRDEIVLSNGLATLRT